MYVERVPNRTSRPAVLLREAWREGKKIRKRTVANITHWPEERIELMRRLLKGEALVPAGEAFEVERSRPHGHVVAVLGTLRRIGLETALASRRSRERDLVVAMVAARILDPRSKLAAARGLGEESAFSTLAEELSVESADADELYAALDWLVERQARIEAKLAKRHLRGGTLVLYDVTSSYFEGRKCPLARFGYSRDQKKGKPQIVFGLLCTAEGCPVAVEVFAGNTTDPETLASAVEKVCQRFALKRVVLDWITALRAPTIRKLARATRRKRQPLRGQDKIGVEVGEVIDHYKVAKHFRYRITDDSFTYERNVESIEREAALDGVYVIRTNVPDRHLDAEAAVEAYKSLSTVERAFRSYKTVDLEVRPIHHYAERRARAHIFLCMLAYYVEWHMRRALAPILFDDHDRASAQAERRSIVAPAQRSAAAKARTGRTEDGLPVHSFQTLLRDLATLTKNRVRVAESTFEQLALPTPVQERAFELLEVVAR